MRRALALAIALLALTAPVALAHQGNPHYRSVVKTITPATSGLDVTMTNFDDSLLLVNKSGKDITILDYKEQPYAQVLADGTVKVNTASEAYYLNEDRLGETPVPTDLPKTPQWKELSKSGRFEWHDHRSHWMGTGDPPNLKNKDVKTFIDSWKVPVEIAGTKGTIAGTLTWVPLDEGGLPLGAIFAFAALLIVLCVIVFIVRRRRDDPETQERKEPVEAW
jgi:hypothetical protein